MDENSILLQFPHCNYRHQLPVMPSAVSHPLLAPSRDQQRLHALLQLGPGFDLAFHIAGMARLRLPLIEEAARIAVGRILARHSALRTLLPLREGQIRRQVLAAEDISLPLSFADCSQHADPEQALQQIWRAQLAQGFNLQQELPWRVVICCMRKEAGQEEFIVLLCMHHLSGDFISTVLFAQEFAHYYPLVLQSGAQLTAEQDLPTVDDEAALQELARREQQAVQDQADEVRARLRQLPPLQLRAGAKPLWQRNLRLAHQKITLPPALQQQMQDWGNQALPTCLAAFALWLAQISGQDRFAFGLPLDLRPGRAHRQAIGFLSRPACIVFDVGSDLSLQDLQAEMRSQIRHAQHQRFFPLDSLNEKGEGAGSTPPRLNVLFNWLQANQGRTGGGAARIEPVFGEFLHADMDLWFTVHECAEGYALKLEYNQELFPASFFSRFATQYLSLLQAFAQDGQSKVGALLQRGRDGSGEFRLQLACSFSSDALLEQMREWQLCLGRRWHIQSHAYRQVLPALLQRQAQGSLFILAIRLQDFFYQPQEGNIFPFEAQAVAQLCAELENALRHSLTHKQIPHLLLFCPVSELGQEWQAWKEVQENWHTSLQHQQWPGLYLHSCLQTSGKAWPGDWQDPSSLQLAHLPWKTAAWRSLAYAILRYSWQYLSVMPKVLAIDCDNTLWQGVIGEDGMDGIRLTEAHLALQQRLLQLQAQGLLLTLVSKNNEEQAMEVLASHPQMLLRPQHLAAWRINWQDKAANILELARELNLDSEAFVLLDDSPLEIAQVSQALPHVLCVQIPDDEAALAAFARHLWLFSLPQLQTTAQAGQSAVAPDRTLGRHQEQAREALRADYQDLAGFIAQLQLVLEIKDLDCRDAPALARASQLSLRTNQFKLNHPRMSELALQTWLQEEGQRRMAKLCFCRDRFGDYGSTGLLLLEVRDGQLWVHNFFLSCRVLARGVELAVLAHLLQIARSLQCQHLRFEFQASGRNQVGLAFLQRLCALDLTAGGTEQGSGPDWQGGGVVAIPASSTCPAVQEWYAQDVADTPLAPGNHSSPVSGTRRARLDDAHTLQAGWQEARMLEQALTITASPVQAVVAGADDVSQIRQRLETIWAEYFPGLNPEQDFHQQGGGSLAAVHILARLQQEFGAQLGIGEFYQHPSLPQLARLIAAGRQAAESPAVNPRAPWWQDLDLAADWLTAGSRAPLAQAPAVGSPRHILLTGASGFIGIHLLAELLREPDLEVTCLLRARDAEHAAQRLQEISVRYAQPLPDRSRLHLLAADLEQPQLGLKPTEWDRLADDVDCVLHCAAQVNFFASYQQLRAANVLGTRSLLQLCAQQRSKKFILVSSMGVWHGPQHMQAQELPETLATGTPDSLPSGYQQSKWVAEKLLARALEQGLDAHLVRIGTALAQPQTGALNHADVVVHLFAAAQEWGILPQLRALDLLPVDFVARALCAICLHARQPGQVYHLTQPAPLSLQQLQIWAEWGGNALQVLPLAEWRAQVGQLLAARPEHPLAVLQALLDEHGLLAMLLQAPPAVTHNCRQFLHSRGLAFPAPGPAQLQRYRQVLVQNRLLTADSTALLQSEANQGLALSLFSSAETMHGFVQMANVPPANAGNEFDQACRQAYQAAAGHPDFSLRFDLRCHVRDHVRLWQEQRVILSGHILCPQLHAAPLQVVDGWFVRAPFAGYRPGAGDSLLFLQYRIQMRSADGREYLLRGHKLSREFAHLFAEIAELMVCITPLDVETAAPGAARSASAYLGMVRQDFASLFAEQVNSLRYRPGLNRQQQMLCQLSWLGFLLRAFGSNYLNLFLRRQSWTWRDSLRLWQALRTLPGAEQWSQRWQSWRKLLQGLLGANPEQDGKK